MSRSRKNSGLRFERCEDRRLMAADIVLDAGQLQITGTDQADEIAVEEDTYFVRRYFGGRWTYTQMDVVKAAVSDAAGNTLNRRVFSASAVDDILARGLGGDDTIINNTDLPSVLVGDGGNDLLQGGSRNDYLIGGSGHDTLYGRAGTDFLFGGADNDGLFGGEHYDRLYGGSGANRFLIQTDQVDARYHVGSDDAVVYFRDGNLINSPYGIWTGADWTDEEIELVDSALAMMHERTGNTLLLKTAYGQSMTFVRQGHEWFSASNFGGWNDNGVITLNDSAFDNWYFRTEAEDRLYTQEVVLHEVAHNWDTTSENYTNGGFRNISGWYTLNGTWVINDSSEFISDYSREGPLEDFAEHFAAYFQGDDFLYALPGVSTPRKDAYMSWFVDNIETVVTISGLLRQR